MPTAFVREFQIELLFDKRPDGLYHIHSDALPGLHLAGDDFDALRRDIEPAVKDLLKHNRNLVADEIRWVPSLDEVQQELDGPPADTSRATYVVKMGLAS